MGCPPGWGCWVSPPRDIFVSHVLKEPLVILAQLPATLPLAGNPNFGSPSGDSRLSVAASVSSLLSTWWGLPLPKMKMREGGRSWVPPAPSVITPCHHPCTHLEDTPCLQGIPQSFPIDLGLFSLLWLIFSSPYPQHLENFTLVSGGRGQLFLDGKGQCPFDPQHTYTALLVGEYGAGGLTGGHPSLGWSGG